MKYKCQECGWKGVESQVLTAKNPFDDAQEITGCTECSEVESMALACEAPGCWRDATCGTLSKAGYKQTCYDHRPKDVNKD